MVFMAAEGIGQAVIYHIYKKIKVDVYKRQVTLLYIKKRIPSCYDEVFFRIQEEGSYEE